MSTRNRQLASPSPIRGRTSRDKGMRRCSARGPDSQGAPEDSAAADAGDSSTNRTANQSAQTLRPRFLAAKLSIGLPDGSEIELHKQGRGTI